MTVNYVAIGKRIKLERIKNDMTQEKLAEKTGLSAPHISNVESGSTSLSLKTLIIVSDALSVSPDILLCDNKLLEYKDNLNVRISNCAPLCSMDSTKNSTDEVLTIMAPCDCAKTWIGIDVNGNVLPCPSFRHNCGCLHDKKLKEIWETNSFMIKIRENGFCSGTCITCDYVNICGGGCKSTNIDKDGRLIGIDPYIVRT